MTDADPAQSQQNGRYRGLKPFQPGQSGNPAGRPKGSRNKLSEDFLRDLADQWEKSGIYALERMATGDPGAFVKVCASIIPRQVDAVLSADPELTDALKDARDFATAFRFALEHIGSELAQEVPVIEAEAVDGE